MRKHTIWKYGLLTALCLTLLAGCASSGDSADTQEDVGYWESQQYDALSGSDFIKVGEGGQMQLLLSPATGTIRWLDTATGIYQDTNMAYDEGLANLTNAEQSDIVVRYFSGSKNSNKLYYSTTAYDSYSMSVSRDQLSYMLIDNGVRIVYFIGSDEVTYKNFPLRISDERMQEYVLQYLDAEQAEKLESYYSKLSGGEWIRGFNTTDANKIGSLGLKAVYNLFYEVGQYTDEALYEDLETWEVDTDEYPSNLLIVMGVDYYLDGEELVVNLDTSLIETGKDNPINKLELLSYFLTSSTEDTAEEGYMFVPDNSGSLIYLDSQKTREYHYSASYYNGDPLVNATVNNSVVNNMMLPVFGMKTSNSTIFAVIEEGAEIATLDAYISGTDNSEPFSKMKLTFEIQAQQSISSGATGTSGAFTLYKASEDIYDDNITIRYFWLGKDADYVDMANCYAGYLEENGLLVKEAVEDTASFYVELLGSTDRTQYFLGIPYEGNETLTSFTQAKEILQDLTDEGIGNIKLIYSGMVNGGMNQRSLASGIKLAPGMGGNSAFKSLKAYADSIGATIFPNVQLQTVYTKSNVSKKMAAWNITNERAQIYSFNPVTNAVVSDASYPLYIVSPAYADQYLTKVKKSYSSKIGLDTMASSDLYTFIATNYKNTEASISTGKELIGSAVESFADGMTLMLSNPISEAYAYSNYLTDIPTRDSGMRILDASIPFTQLVLDGYKMYSSESLNKESTDVYVNFMRVIESKSLPKFTFMYEDSALLSGTEQEDYFAVDYSYWKDKIGAYYDEYNTFYNLVKDASIVGHELYERNDKLRVVTYSNGVKLYFNYSDLEENIDGVIVPPFSYVIK